MIQAIKSIHLVLKITDGCQLSMTILRSRYANFFKKVGPISEISIRYASQHLTTQISDCDIELYVIKW